MNTPVLLTFPVPRIHVVWGRQRICAPRETQMADRGPLTLHTARITWNCVLAVKFKAPDVSVEKCWSLYSSENIIRVMRSRTVRWARRIARMG